MYFPGICIARVTGVGHFYCSVAVDPLCGVGWISSGDFCYQLNKEVLSWQDAQEGCVSRSGALTSITDPKEQETVSGVYSHGVRSHANPAQ